MPRLAPHITCLDSFHIYMYRIVHRLGNVRQQSESLKLWLTWVGHGHFRQSLLPACWPPFVGLATTGRRKYSSTAASPPPFISARIERQRGRCMHCPLALTKAQQHTAASFWGKQKASLSPILAILTIF